MTQEQNSTATHSRQSLLDEFTRNADGYQATMAAALSILDRVLPPKVVVAISHRVKDFNSFYEKANKQVDSKLKYTKPFEQILDLVGIRIVVIAQRNVPEVRDAIRSALEVFEEEDKAAELLKKGQLGYESYHFLCCLGNDRAGLREYAGLCSQPFEIQVRTALQHAWAENEHRIQYKKSKNPELQKRFLRLAAAISSADEEFDRIYEINEQLQKNAEAAEAEITGADIDATSDALGENDHQLSQVSLLFGKRPSELLAANRPSEAIQVYDRFIDMQPNQVTHYVGRAKARALAGDIDGGLADLAVAEMKSPEHQSTKALKRFFDRLLKNVNEDRPPTV
ncbi:GTP pyrophosphokinase [Agrobacterium salinitolerans]|uniref:GTP pyrophosphokinase n=1 Tax=Agrobacterium salinitolerans TaxID=1183413 RepID=UPI001572B5D0|nr:RelA/SpoT domain-containing protein [Agrobacterium salinitolerans]NTA40334.1 RelA/SpoT domain-containing protein [Agrobacterium salinitolerans]